MTNNDIWLHDYNMSVYVGRIDIIKYEYQAGQNN